MATKAAASSNNLFARPGLFASPNAQSLPPALSVPGSQVKNHASGSAPHKNASSAAHKQANQHLGYVSIDSICDNPKSAPLFLANESKALLHFRHSNKGSDFDDEDDEDDGEEDDIEDRSSASGSGIEEFQDDDANDLRTNCADQGDSDAEDMEIKVEDD